MNKKGEKFRLKYNPRFPHPVYESLGTIQINRPELKKFVDRINDDLNNKVYFNKLLDVKKHKRYVPLKADYIFSNAKMYLIEYKNIDVDWIENFDIVVIEDGSTKSHIENCAAKPGITLYDKYNIKNGCIIVYNISGSNQIRNFRGGLYHELHHYFIDLNRFVNTCLQLSDEDYYNDVFRDNAYFIKNRDNNNTIDFHNYYEIDDYNNYISSLKTYNAEKTASEINKIFATMCYWLNNDEIECHIEEIFDIYVRYCKRYGFASIEYSNENLIRSSTTLKSYVVIMRLLRDIEKILITPEVIEQFDIHFSFIYYEIFKHLINPKSDDVFTSKPQLMTIHQICNKFLSKVKKVSKHFRGMSNYIRTGYVC